MKKIAIAVLLVLTACGTTSTGVIPMGNNTFMTSSRGDTGFAPMSGIRAEALMQASTHCASQGRGYQPISTREVNAGLGIWPEYEIQFSCTEIRK